MISSKCKRWALVEYILFCHVLWWVFYYLLLIATRQSAEWCCRFVTLIHGCLVSYAAITDIFTRETNMSFGSHSLSEAQKTYLSYMLSYFLFDFGWMHLFGNEKWIIYVHHITSIVIIINVLIRSYGGDGVSYGVAGLEFSNPYLQLRWFLRTHGQLNKPIHMITELWFVFVFFFIRMVGGTILLYRGLLSPQIDYGMKLSFIAIYSISVVLQWQICGFVKKKYIMPEARRSRAFLRHRESLSPYFQKQTYVNSDEDMEEPPDEEKIIPGPTTTVVESVTMETTNLESALSEIPDIIEEVSLKNAKPPSIITEDLTTPEVPSTPKSPAPEASQGEISENEKPETSQTENPAQENLDTKSEKKKPLILKIKR